jgi:predicted nucleic acid-binding protein
VSPTKLVLDTSVFFSLLLGRESAQRRRLIADPAFSFHFPRFFLVELFKHKERVAAKKATINGVDIADLAKTVEWGRKVVEYRAEGTVKAIQKAIEK